MTSIGVIFCNPPYSTHSLNKGEWILKLVKDYWQDIEAQKDIRESGVDRNKNAFPYSIDHLIFVIPIIPVNPGVLFVCRGRK